MNDSQKAGKPEKTKESWNKKYAHLHKLHEDTYNLLVKRLKERTIKILDARFDLQEEIDDAGSADTKGGSCLGAHNIMDNFYNNRLNWDNLPDTAAKHILIWSTVYFEDTPSVDCVGNVVRGVLQELYALLDNEHPEKKVEFALQPTDSQKE